VKEIFDMPNPPSPTVRARRLRKELERLREVAGLTHADAARRLGWHASKISRIETGHSRAHHGDVRDMVEAYGVTDPATVQELVQLAKEARKRGWWTRYSDVFSDPYIGLEAEASRVRMWEPQYVPGLLQTEDYARAVIANSYIRPDPEVTERRVTPRMKRKEILAGDEPPTIWAILDEPAIRRPVGGASVMRDQLRHLIDIATSPDSTITLQVLPLDVGAHIGMSGPFTVIEFPSPKDPPVIYLEMSPQALFLEDSPDIEAYTMQFEHLMARALGPDQSRNVIIDAIEHLSA
jgi:transcriptional regulator with XRE-family HTH domain